MGLGIFISTTVLVGPSDIAVPSIRHIGLKLGANSLGMKVEVIRGLSSQSSHMVDMVTMVDILENVEKASFLEMTTKS